MRSTTVTTTPASARTDADVAATRSSTASAGGAAGGEHPASGGAPVDATFVRRRGAVLAAGAALWAGAMFTYGSTPDSSFGIMVQDLTGLAFQVGVMALLSVQGRTMATGTGRVARAMIPVERVVLALAMVWSAVHGLAPAFRDAPWLAVLDITWPLSMLGMFVIGIKIAVAGRWSGIARVWPLVAETWAVVTVPVYATIGGTIANVVGGIHLLVGYATLGLILVARPHLVGARR
jgi:hypothetical protein